MIDCAVGGLWVTVGGSVDGTLWRICVMHNVNEVSGLNPVIRGKTWAEAPPECSLQGFCSVAEGCV